MEQNKNQNLNSALAAEKNAKIITRVNVLKKPRQSGLYLFGYLIIVFLNLKSLYLPVFEPKPNRL